MIQIDKLTHQTSGNHNYPKGMHKPMRGIGLQDKPLFLP